jgi:error-prone DNA polymerase
MPEYSGFSRKKLVLEGGGPNPPAPFVELGVTTPFSFLRGASDAIELVMQAHDFGMDAIGVADRNTLAGVVRMHSAAKGAMMRPLIGCRLDLTDAPSLLAYLSTERAMAGCRDCSASARCAPTRASATSA